MFRYLFAFLDSNKRQLNKIRPIVEEINLQEPRVSKLTQEEFAKKTKEFKERLAQGETLEEILPEAFALVRELSKRINNERSFDVQLLAGICLHQGKVVEQKTGEGKTLSAAHALYLNALTGKGCHLVTVNDYLARRDCGWMGPIYYALGLSCAAIVNNASFLYDPNFVDKKATDWRLVHLRPISRKEAYQADITYGINSEFGFDYLKDNMAYQIEEVVQRPFYYAIVDEVDSVLIDEARTPHIISVPDVEPTEKYYEFARLVEKLNPATDFVIDEKLKTAHLTEHGIAKVEKMLGIENLYERNFATLHHLENALKAKTLYFKDRDYVVKEGEVILVDEFTGRLLFGRRYSAGLHQAIEAKEGVPIKQESKTLATISLQNYFRMYPKLAGMTGTAVTEAEEFKEIYNLDVVVIPTNKPMIRKDLPDKIYKTLKAKYSAVANEIAQRHKKGQPVLVGTTSIEKNEIISRLLRHKGIPHQVLNAKNHEKEALIIAQAGTKGAVTVATNIAGRGVDIILGGEVPKDAMGRVKKGKEFEEWKKAHEEVVNLGGLHVIGTEHHESRRIDNQLRGRAGRQGDPGSSQFFVSLQDDIIRLFGGERVEKLMTRFKMPENIPLEHPVVTKAIEQAQIKVESFYFDIRKNVLQYDDVMNKQREVVYKLRRSILEKEELNEEVFQSIERAIRNIVLSPSDLEFNKEKQNKISKNFLQFFRIREVSPENLEDKIKKFNQAEEVINFLTLLAKKFYQKKKEKIEPALFKKIEKIIYLSTIDSLWIDHLDAMEELREGIGLRGYGQKDPLVEYKAEAFAMFEQLMTNIDSQVLRRIFSLSPQPAPSFVLPPKILTRGKNVSFSAPLSTPLPGGRQTPLPKKKIGRNAPCPCGSGKKYKKCHLGRGPETKEEQEAFTLYFQNYKEWQKRYGGRKK